MATLTIRNVDETVKQKIREEAARNGVSMEALVRQILEDAVTEAVEPDEDIMTLIRAKFAETGFKGIKEGELEIAPRDEYMVDSLFEEDKNLELETAK